MKRLVISIGIVCALLGAGWWWSGRVGQVHDDRNQQRIARLVAWQAALNQRQQTDRTFPVGQATVSGSGQVSGSALTADLGPRLPKPNDTLYYHGTQSAYVLCTALDPTKRSQLWRSPQQAFFVTAEGSFVAPQRDCNQNASIELANLATATTMTPEAANNFFRARPELADKAKIQSACSDSLHDNPQSVQFAGCLTDRIYLLRITEPEAADEVTVTAAHEMLHVAYSRLTSEERRQVDAWLEQAVAALNNTTLNEELQLYSAEERLDELHARLGTEVASLPPELEQYYRRYFTNRQSLAAIQERYNALLSTLTTQLDQLDARLNVLDAQAKANQSAGNITAYNALVDPYNALLAQYNAIVDRYNALTAHTRQQNEQLPTQ